MARTLRIIAAAAASAMLLPLASASAEVPCAERVPDRAAGVVWAATLPDDGPTGGFSEDAGVVP